MLGATLALLLSGGDEDPAAPQASGPAGEQAIDRSGAEPGARMSARVLDVVDGDTIEVELGGSPEDVRLIGVDTPETVDPDEPVGCFGPEASEFTQRLLEGHEVELRFDAELRDDYGRLLAFVYLGRRFVNAELVERGLARTLVIEPNDSAARPLARLEARAGAAGRGLWGAC